jgi:hypothetical protein
MNIRFVLCSLVVLSIIKATPAFAGMYKPRTIAERAQGSDKVVVGKIASIKSEYRKNKWGDELIISTAEVEVEETLKGRHLKTENLVFEGGTVGDMTLDVSTIDAPSKGDRAVLFMKKNSSGENELFLEGQGLLNLDGQGRVPRTSLDLSRIRQMVKEAGGAE